VLSKLRYLLRPTIATCSADLHKLQSAISRHIEVYLGPVTLNPIVGSTLGICFRADTATRPFFIKTHRSDESSRENLLKELEILKVLYGHLIHLERLDVNVASDRQTCIVMEWLDIITDPIKPSDLRTIIGECYEKLSEAAHDRAAQFSTIADLICDGEQALFELERLQLISADTCSRIKPYIASAKNTVSDLQPVICHGDLSNNNIMLIHDRNVVIDWEDSFVGFAGYDYLYWLTFMTNRKYLSRAMLGHTALDEESERGVLLTIVAIKSLISVRSQAIQSFRVPIEERLLEVLAF
jgi:hypothetical protein